MKNIQGLEGTMRGLGVGGGDWETTQPQPVLVLWKCGPHVVNPPPPFLIKKNMDFSVNS